MKPAILISALLLTACMPAHSGKSGTPTEKPKEVIPPPDQQVMCTMDAMQCADGSWVGRSGPNCEFVCPPAPKE